MVRPTRTPEPSANWQLITGILAVVFVALALLALLTILGGGSDSETPRPTASAGASASPASNPSALPTAEPSGGASGEPSPGSSPASSPGASAEASPGASASPTAAGCSGSDANREFFAEAAEALAFETYCAVLPSGWSLVSGGYRGASGGRLEISYKGPGGATLLLRQGPAACADDPACPPTGTDLGEATYGDRPGALLQTDAGFAVDASAGATLYLAQTTRLDQAGTTALVAALIPIR